MYSLLKKEKLNFYMKKNRFKSVVCLLSSLTNALEDREEFEGSVYSGTSDKGPSEIGTTSLQRTLVAAPC